MNEPPKRTESTELTVVRPRDSLAPRSAVPGPTIEQLADVERARRDAAEGRETLMECPWCHDGLVAHQQHAEWLAKYPELEAAQPPPSQPDPDSEPPPRAA